MNRFQHRSLLCAQGEGKVLVSVAEATLKFSLSIHCSSPLVTFSLHHPTASTAGSSSKRKALGRHHLPLARTHTDPSSPTYNAGEQSRTLLRECTKQEGPSGAGGWLSARHGEPRSTASSRSSAGLNAAAPEMQLLLLSRGSPAWPRPHGLEQPLLAAPSPSLRVHDVVSIGTN